MERLAQRHPAHAAFQQLYAHLLENRDTTDNVFVAGGSDKLRTAIMEEHIAVSKAPRPALADALTAVRSVNAKSTPAEAHRAAAAVRAQAGALTSEERGALLQDVYTQDRLHLAPRADGRTRLALAEVAGELLHTLDDDRRKLMTSDLLHVGVDLLYNHPEAADGAKALLDRTYDGLEGRRLGWLLSSFSGPLTRHEAGRAVVERQLDRLVATATEPSSILALESLSGRTRLLQPRKDDLLAHLGDAVVEGDLAKPHADLVRRLQGR